MPAVIPIAAAIGLGGGTTTVVALVVGVTLLSLATAALSWWRFSYVDGPTSVVVTRGLVSRSVRTVPNDRIRGVEVEAPPLHRLFGLVRVRIDAAAGSAGQGRGAPRRRRHRAPRATGCAPPSSRTARRPRPGTAHRPPEPGEEEFARFDNRWLLYAPLVGSYLAVPAGRGRRAVPAGRRAAAPVPARPRRARPQRRPGRGPRGRRGPAPARAGIGGRRRGGELGLPPGPARRLARSPPAG